VQEGAGVADNLSGLNAINGGKIHGPVRERSFLNRRTAYGEYLHVPLIAQHTFVDDINVRRRSTTT
jgi:hypothetical protein